MHTTGERAARGGWARSAGLLIAAVAAVAAVASLAPLARAHPNHQSVRDLTLFPFPLQVMAMRGTVTLAPSSRIVATDPALLPLAGLLQDELTRLTGLTPAVSEEKARPGDIVLRLDDRFTTAESYAIVVADRVTVVAGNVKAVTLATTTFLQALGTVDGVTSLLKMRISDEPAFAFRSARMRVDSMDEAALARLCERIELCRWYRLNVLQVELGEAVLRDLCTRDEARAAKAHLAWRKLEAFAALRGVELTPVVSAAAANGAGEPDAVIAALAVAFASAEHVGITGPDESAGTRDATAVTRLVRACRGHGKLVLLDETAAIDPGVLEPADVVIVARTAAGRWLDAGYRVVNASVPPLRLSGEAETVSQAIYTDWEPWGWMTTDAGRRLSVVEERAGLIGAQVELVAGAADQTTHWGVAATAERLWDPKLRRDFADLMIRIEHTQEGFAAIRGGEVVGR